MKQFTFDDLPDIIVRLSLKIGNIEKLLPEQKTGGINPDELLTVDEAAKFIFTLLNCLTG